MSTHNPRGTDSPQHTADGDEALAQATRRMLDARAEAIDGATLSRLRQARARAVEAAAQRQPWSFGGLLQGAWLSLGSRPAAVAATLAMVVVTLAVVSREPLPEDLGTAPGGALAVAGDDAAGVAAPLSADGLAVDGLEIVLAGDSIEMLEDLEFYEWLAAQPVI